MMQKTRNQSLDILRIFSMLLIIMIHFQGKTGWLRASDSLGLASDWWIRWSTLAFCNTSVNCYVLISGYFLVNSKFKLSKVFSLWLKVIFWSLFFLVFSYFVWEDTITVKQVIFSIFPISFSEYWFITNYIGLFLLSPFLNKLIHSMDQKSHQSLILISVLLFSVWSTIFGDTFNGHDGCNLIWFSTLYIVAAYFRLYNCNYFKNKRLYIYVALMIALMYIPIRAFGIYIGKPGLSEIFLPYASITCFLSSCALFLFFVNTHISVTGIFQSIIGYLSVTSLGVYLIHEHTLVRPHLWSFVSEVTNGGNMFYFRYFFLMVITSIAIYLFCSVLELFRSILMKKVENANVISRFSDFLQEKIYKI